MSPKVPPYIGASNSHLPNVNNYMGFVSSLKCALGFHNSFVTVSDKDISTKCKNCEWFETIYLCKNDASQNTEAQRLNEMVKDLKPAPPVGELVSIQDALKHIINEDPSYRRILFHQSKHKVNERIGCVTYEQTVAWLLTCFNHSVSEILMYVDGCHWAPLNDHRVVASIGEFLRMGKFINVLLRHDDSLLKNSFTSLLFSKNISVRAASGSYAKEDSKLFIVEIGHGYLFEEYPGFSISNFGEPAISSKLEIAFHEAYKRGYVCDFKLNNPLS